MSPSLPPRPSLEWLRKTAKDRLAQCRAADPEAKLAEAQRLVARDYGFASWRALKRHVERPPSAPQAAPEEMVAAFLRAVGRGRLEQVRILLEMDPTLVTAVGPHPFWGGRPQALHVAIETRRPDMFGLLLEHGADVNGTNDGYDHWSPVMLAINRNQQSMLDELLRRGARVGLLEALMLGDDARVEALLRDGTLPAIAPNAGSILAFARTPFAIDRLIELGAPAGVKDRWGSTAIDAISRLGPRGRPLVEHMLARGIAAAPRDYARVGDQETLARLIDADPSVARLDSVIMAAVDFGHHAMVESLLARGANVNARSDAVSRHTALHSAAWNGDLRMVRLLVDAGADVNALDEQYYAPPAGWAQTSIEVTNNQKCAEVVAFLSELARPEA